MHAAFHLSLVPQVSLQLAAFCLLGLELFTLNPSFPELSRSPASNHASGMALDHYTLLKHQRSLVRAAKVGSSRSLHNVVCCVNVEPHLGHLGPILLFALRRPSPMLACLHLPVKSDGVQLPLLRRSGLGYRMMVLQACLLVPETTKVRLLHRRTLDMHDDELFLASCTHHFQLQGVWHDVFLRRLLLIVVYAQLYTDLVVWLDAKVIQALLVGKHVFVLHSPRQIQEEERVLRDAQLVL
mmetsp:Transcript_66368/g.154222  ORF Transcript_66368/g.154222 Transcript_66368/m.154222 type:complete len:240 (-) Transcript_66368:359-1078(-)